PVPLARLAATRGMLEMLSGRGDGLGAVRVAIEPVGLDAFLDSVDGSGGAADRSILPFLLVTCATEEDSMEPTMARLLSKASSSGAELSVAALRVAHASLLARAGDLSGAAEELAEAAPVAARVPTLALISGVTLAYLRFLQGAT
ncbi:MAG: hypothetical protein ACYDH5_11575, partial [Acidimicrobiales bacterium]